MAGPHLNRRELIVGGGSTLALTALSPARRAQAANDELCRELFEQMLGQRIWVLDLATWSWLPALVSEIVEGPVDPGVDQFTVILSNEAARALPAGNYWIMAYQPRWGIYQLHLQPSSVDAGAASYYAAPFAQLL